MGGVGGVCSARSVLSETVTGGVPPLSLAGLTNRAAHAKIEDLRPIGSHWRSHANLPR